MTKFVFETPVSHTVEDGGQSHILEFETADGQLDGLFVRVQSYAPPAEHIEIMKLVDAVEDGKIVRVTVEVVDN